MTKSFTKRCFSRAKRNMIQQQKSDPTQQHMYQGDKFQSISSLKLKTRGTSKQSQKVKASLGYSLPINISINGIYSQVLIKPPTSCHTVIYVIAHSLLPFTEKKEIRSQPIAHVPRKQVPEHMLSQTEKKMVHRSNYKKSKLPWAIHCVSTNQSRQFTAKSL